MFPSSTEEDTVMSPVTIMRSRCGYCFLGSAVHSESLMHVSLDSEVVGMPYLVTAGEQKRKGSRDS
jgi:hypothetical protein